MKYVYFFFIATLSTMVLSCSGVLPTGEYLKYRKGQESHVLKEGEIKYVDKGEGEVIVLLHGVPSSGWLYRKMVDGLVESGYRVIVPDMLGYGNSSNPEGYEIYKPEYQADRLVSLMDSLGVKEWNHVFHDVGGMWTWELVRKHKRRVKKLVMLNSINLTEGFFPPLRMKDDWLAKAAMKAYEKRGSNKVMINQLFKETVNDPKQISASDKAGYKLPLLEGKTNGIYYFFTQTCNLLPNYTSVIEDADIETAVVWGKNDEMLRWTPQATKLKRMLKIKESNIHLLDAKHFLQEEKPEELNAILVDFFRN